jgi:uncharacterized membrane protein (UPF0127 family)
MRSLNRFKAFCVFFDAATSQFTRVWGDLRFTSNAKRSSLNITAAVALMMILLGQMAPASAVCAPDQVSVRGAWGQADFKIELADDTDERALGLMHRTSLPRFGGMLFVYPVPQRAQFWMKNTLIPLDMIFVGPDGVVRAVHAKAVPGDLTTIDGGPGVLAVLEINGGLAKTLGISAGDALRHPAFGADAAWPCP